MQKTDNTLETILELEYQIQTTLAWLDCFTIQKDLLSPGIVSIIYQLHNNYNQYQRYIPENIYHQKVKNILKQTDLIKSNLIAQEDEEGLMPWIKLAQIANKIRIDTNVSMTLVRYFIPFSKQPISQLQYWKTTSETLSSLGVCIPFASILLVGYRLFQKLQLDKAHPESRSFLLHYHKNKFNIYRNFLAILLNFSNFIVSFYQLFEIRFYFSFLSICIDYLFFLVDYDNQLDRLHQKEIDLYLHLGNEFSQMETFHHLSYANKCQLLKELFEQYPQHQFTIYEFLINQQQQAILHDAFILECIAMIVMLSTMIVLQQSGLIHPDIMLLIGLISSYFNIILKSYFIDYIIEFRHQETIELQGPNQEPLAITLGQVYHASGPTPTIIHEFTRYSMIARTLVPITAILLSQTLTPGLIILMLASLNLTIHCTEEYLKYTSAENLALNPS